MTEVWGDLTVKVVRGIDLQNTAVFGTCNPYVLVKVRSSLDSMTTSVKDGEANPSWQDTFTFRNVSSSDDVQISLMEKEGSREGVVSVSEFLPSTSWGFPGTGGAERIMHVAMPSSGGRKVESTNMGTVVLKLQYRAEMHFRAIFGPLKIAAAKTGVATEKAKIDVALDKALNLLFRPITLAEDVAGRMTTTQKMLSGGAAALAGGGISVTAMVLAVPVGFMMLLFLPLTLMGGFFVGMMALVVLPFVLGLGWVALCTRPVQCRVWMPSIFWLTIKVPLVNKILLRPAAPGSVQ